MPSRNGQAGGGAFDRAALEHEFAKRCALVDRATALAAPVRQFGGHHPGAPRLDQTMLKIRFIAPPR